jgi:hypothetical protein
MIIEYYEKPAVDNVALRDGGLAYIAVGLFAVISLIAACMTKHIV